MPELLDKLKRIGSRFQLDGEVARGESFGSGHINDTFLITCAGGGEAVRYILQRINRQIFKNPAAVMENIQRVTRHLQQKLKVPGEGVRTRRCLGLVPSKDGGICWRDDEGEYWRVYHFIADAVGMDIAATPRHAFEAAAAFGRFQRDLSDLPGERLHETIPGFHHTEKRFEQLRTAIQRDEACRARNCSAEIDFALEREPMAGKLIRLMESGDLPERVTHNDTKINNVLLDRQTHEGLCVIDLDTVMPGSVLYDFGDLVRTGTGYFAEDGEGDAEVRVHMSLFEAIARGYLAEAGAFLTDVERSLLVFSGKLITFETGIRFLADYLNGDPYFKTRHEVQNLNRCRTQFEFLRSLEANEDRMQQYLQRI